MIERNTPLEKIVDYALQLVIEGGMRPTPASRMAAKRYGYSRHHIGHKLTHHPRYIEHQGGKPAGYGVIPASIIDEIIVMLESTPELGLMGCESTRKSRGALSTSKLSRASTDDSLRQMP